MSRRRSLLIVVVAVICALLVAYLTTGRTHGIKRDGPLVVPFEHGWALSYQTGEVFTDGLEVLTLKGSDEAVVESVELVGDKDLELVGVFLAPPPRNIGATQLLRMWPPRDPEAFDEATLVEVDEDGAAITSALGGWELLVGLRATTDGRHHRDGIRISYRVGDQDYEAFFPAQLDVCASESPHGVNDCPVAQS